MTKWCVRADAIDGKPDEVRVPNNWFGEEGAVGAPYIRLSADGKTIVRKVVASGNSDNDQLIVTPGTFDLDDGQIEEKDVTAKPLSRGDYRRDWLTRTAAGQWTIAGILIILAGQVIQVSLDIGKHWVIFDVGPGGIALLNVAKDVLTIGGAVVAAWQVVLKS